MAAWLGGWEVTAPGSRTVAFGGGDPLDSFRTFVTMVMLTRALVE